MAYLLRYLFYHCKAVNHSNGSLQDNITVSYYNVIEYNRNLLYEYAIILTELYNYILYHQYGSQSFRFNIFTSEKLNSLLIEYY